MMELWRRAVRACFGGRRRDIPAPDAAGDGGSLPDSGVRDTMAEIDRIFADVPAEAWEETPRDLSEQHDHYIYGVEKSNTEPNRN